MLMTKSWEDLTNDTLIDYLKENYSSYKFEWKEDRYECNLGKNVFLTCYVGKLDEKMSWWNSNILVHVGVEQKKGILQGSSGAVDNFEDLKLRIDDCIKCGKEWIEDSTMEVKKNKSVKNKHEKKDFRRRLF